MIVNKPYTNKEYADLAVYCNKNNCHIEDKGDYLESVQNPPLPEPTDEEQALKRAAAYALDVDPITAHIQRLRDEAEPDEEKITELMAERKKRVEEIKAQYPYKEEISND